MTAKGFYRSTTNCNGVKLNQNCATALILRIPRPPECCVGFAIIGGIYDSWTYSHMLDIIYT